MLLCSHTYNHVHTRAPWPLHARSLAGEVMLRKQGRSEVLRKQTVPDLVFYHFMNKYGQRKVANKYVGSLANSLMLHRAHDQRLGEWRVNRERPLCG